MKRCHELRAPFSDNYCRDWLLYNGSVTALFMLISGLLLWASGWQWLLIWPVVAVLCAIGPIAGALIYIIDRQQDV